MNSSKIRWSITERVIAIGMPDIQHAEIIGLSGNMKRTGGDIMTGI